MELVELGLLAAALFLAGGGAGTLTVHRPRRRKPHAHPVTPAALAAWKAW